MRIFDLIIIGSGPGGYVAALKAKKLYKKVALIEMASLGGVCLNRGCVPTKCLLKSAHELLNLKNFSSLGIDLNLDQVRPSFQKAMENSRQVVEKLTKGLLFSLQKAELEIIYGTAKFKSNEVIEVSKREGGLEEVSAKKIIIATGAKIKEIEGLKLDGKRVLSPFSMLRLTELPKRLAIVGAGAIGVEFATVFSAFGTQVSLFERKAHLLPLEDEDASLALERAFSKKRNIDLHLGIGKISTKNLGEEVLVRYTVADKDEESTLNVDIVLVAVGMQGATDRLGLETTDVLIEQSFIKVNEAQETNVKGIYAIGDVSGSPLLAHVASYEALVALKLKSSLKRDALVSCTYSSPQVASVGKNQKDLTLEGRPYKVGKAFFMANARALAEKMPEGFIKVLLSEDHRLLGVHVVSDMAAELIHSCALSVSLGLKAEDVLSVLLPHPTMGEALHDALEQAISSQL